MDLVRASLEKDRLRCQDCFVADSYLLGREERGCGYGGGVDEEDARDGIGEVGFLLLPDLGGGLLDGFETFHGHGLFALAAALLGHVDCVGG